MSIKSQECEPRLLLVAVDVQDCTTAMTFDSYPKENGEHYSEYGADHASKVIEYHRVTMNHVLASMSTHQGYEYPHEEVGRETRYYWDGAYLSNTTPLREVLQYHKDYWHKVHGPDRDASDLEVCT
jgi:NTE family protein